MRKFKTGDKIVRVDNHQGHAPLGFTAVVTDNHAYLDVDGDTIPIVEDLWELAEDTSAYHKHHDLIIQWAKGAEIEYNSPMLDRWTEVALNRPSWNEDTEYRIKPPVPKTDKERIAELEARVAELESSND